MKNKKGFTLIELLAIIVILAIIAVITVPIILNIIDNSKKGSVQDSALGYKDAVQEYYMNRLVDNKNNELPSGVMFVYELPNDLVVDGQIPTNDSWVRLAKGHVVEYSLKFGDYTVTKYKDSNLIVEKGNVAELILDPVSFSIDSWATIKKAIDGDNTSLYSVGNTKEVEIDLNQNGTIESTESFTVRLSNKTFDGCNTEANGFSQTACGFVFEFIDTIGDNHAMNTSSTNNGGWPASSMYSYLNDDNNTNDIVSIYEKLPSSLKSVISDTYTVSGHGQYGSNNLISTNKLYLLSEQEVFGDNSQSDTASDKTKQLEYYLEQDSTVIKDTTSDVSSDWWLRTANPYWGHTFFYVNSSGVLENTAANVGKGVTPAFRIVKSSFGS